ncbi:hypothetical protein FB451DRAFT_1370841 [Mycena latifolia]|nr:hypothetical protein FB451DRAFT_1370841 [Mycena latifolia]
MTVEITYVTLSPSTTTIGLDKAACAPAARTPAPGTSTQQNLTTTHGSYLGIIWPILCYGLFPLSILLALDTSRKLLPGLNQPRAPFGDLGGLLYGAVPDPGVLYVHLSTRMLLDMRDGKRGQEETQRRADLVFSNSGAWPLLLLLSEHQDPWFRVSDTVHYLCCAGHSPPACALAEGGIAQRRRFSIPPPAHTELPMTPPYTPTVLALALARPPELAARRRKALRVPHYRCAAALVASEPEDSARRAHIDTATCSSTASGSLRRRAFELIRRSRAQAALESGMRTGLSQLVGESKEGGQAHPRALRDARLWVWIQARRERWQGGVSLLKAVFSHCCKLW